MVNWKSWLERKKVLIADGGWGTELINLGLKPGQAPEAWNIERPEDVRAVALSYVEAGADIILTNTFGGNPMKLSVMGLKDRAAEINRIGAKISREASGGRALVFGSIGPTGVFMAPLGPVTATEMMDCFAEQAKALVEGGVDGIVIETMIDLAEAKAALRGVKESTSLPVAVTLTFDKTPRGYTNIMGVRPELAAGELEKAGANMVGANCGTGIENMVEVARLMRKGATLPIWCKPNAGLPEFIDNVTVYRETPAEMASKVKDLIEAGVSIVGGCCGTTPAHIRAFVKERDKWLAS